MLDLRPVAGNIGLGELSNLGAFENVRRSMNKLYRLGIPTIYMRSNIISSNKYYVG